MNTEPEQDNNNATDAPAPYSPEARAQKESDRQQSSKGLHFSWNVRQSPPVKTPAVKQVPAKKEEKTPAPSQAELPPVPQAAPKAEPEKQEENKETPVKTEEPEKEEKLPQEESTEPVADSEKENTPKITKQAEKPAKTKTGWGSILLDTFLFLGVCGGVGFGAWYIHGELKKYDIPSPMELAIEEQEELCKRREQLQEPAFRADEQIHMRQKLDSLIRQAEDLNRQIEEKKASIAHEHSRVMALQHEIRTEDRALRGVARGLLPGMNIGHATTTTGKTYPDAVIYRIQGNRITLRTRIGQSSFPIQQLIKDNLPDMARYAFGLDDMVDMSDFETAAGKKKEQKKRKGKLIAPRKDKQAATKDYDPAAGAPVVDTESHRTSTNTAGDILPEQQQETWQPPTGDLPI